MASIKEYTISVPDLKLAQLRAKLENTDFLSDLDEARWQYGSPLPDIKKFHSNWLHSSDWWAHEKRINELPNFETQIDVEGFCAVDMHFVHQKRGVKGAIPLLFAHEWPGSFWK
jgi:hypothetical protein